MARKPKRPCNQPGCRTLTSEGRCEEHRHYYNRYRGTTTQQGYGYRWQQARKGYLQDNPLCVICREQGIRTAANVVDHIIPHRGDTELFWNRRNWQPLCSSCHSRKTAMEDAGFGNRRKNH
ncbi:HNH endonuclease [Sporosarcina newyorkensis]|uniref:Putative HNH nuclease YajD n=1 Tax=Sporosarcina newyorkensis TaxID=759851 RepID=A0A1T4YTV0_9BACL|nr:HNH endonuclease signature motif containing protein [Sporosarcina newyorkensis]SKB05146.1 5-methylcytosine-specific restriction enzyme A [Sporosarcina newyorkensis]